MATSATHNGVKRVIGSSTSLLEILSQGGRRMDFGSVTLTSAGADSGAVLHGLGTSSGRVTTGTAGKKFMSYYTESSATSDDSRGFYMRHYILGVGGGGEAIRSYATVLNVAASTARGAHISLDFGATGTVTGLGVALECTLHIPNQGTQTGTLTALQLAINSDGSTSDPSGALLSYIRCSNQGDTTGDDDVDTDVNLFNITGHATGTGTLFQATTTGYVLSEITHSLKVVVGGTTLHLLASTLGAQAT